MYAWPTRPCSSVLEAQLRVSDLFRCSPARPDFFYSASVREGTQAVALSAWLTLFSCSCWAGTVELVLLRCPYSSAAVDLKLLTHEQRAGTAGLFLVRPRQVGRVGLPPQQGVAIRRYTAMYVFPWFLSTCTVHKSTLRMSSPSPSPEPGRLRGCLMREFVPYTFWNKSPLAFSTLTRLYSIVHWS